MFMIDDEAGLDWQFHRAWLKICNFFMHAKRIYLYIVFLVKEPNIFLSSDVKND